MPFLSAEERPPQGGDQAVITGFPYDGGVSFRSGATEGPDGIRLFSQSIESYSPRARRDLDELVLCDAGDGVDPVAHPGVVNAFLGGDHSITPKLVAAVQQQHPDIAVVGFDAHLDLRETYQGDHACTYRRITEGGAPCFVFGPRSGAREEWDDAPEILAHLSQSLSVGVAMDGLRDRPVYVTVDIDVLDPAIAPGTGNPEPGGPSFDELLFALEALSELDVVAFDVVEVSPPLDPSGVTQVCGAMLVREMLLRYVR